MKTCYFSRKNKHARYLLLIVGTLSFFGLATYGLFIMFAYRLEDRIIIPCGLLMIAVGTFMAIECSFQYRLLNRKYMVDSTGFYVQHIHRNTQCYPWNQILEVCLCNIHQGSHEGINDTVIWCVVGAIKEGPPSVKRRRTSTYYGIRHFYSVITIELSEERISEFKRFYSGSIADYR